MDQQAEKDKTERVTGLGRRTKEEIVKWNQMAALRFQTGGRYQTSPASLQGHILELTEILLSIQTGFSLVNAAVVCAILESISGLEPSSGITEPRYLELVTVSSFCPFTLISVLMPLVLFVISLVFSALISMPWAVEALSRCSTNSASSSSSPAKPSMSSAKPRVVIALPQMLTVPS